MQKCSNTEITKPTKGEGLFALFIIAGAIVLGLYISGVF